jgi:hypothetical protein
MLAALVHFHVAGHKRTLWQPSQPERPTDLVDPIMRSIFRRGTAYPRTAQILDEQVGG